MKEKFDQIELRLQSLIEGSILIFLPMREQQHSIVHEFVELLKSHMIATSDGRYLAPYQYLIHINSSQSYSWILNPELLERLASELEKAAQDAGFFFTKSPIINLVNDLDIPTEDFWIEIPPNQYPITDTTSFSLIESEVNSKVNHDPALLQSFIIANSNTIFRLGNSAVNIGRRSDNHLVLDDPRVSRVHAQIRMIKAHYLIFDLNSKGGTFVNGKRISQATLTRGDVISLAGVPLIFGQDSNLKKSDTVIFDSKPTADLQTESHDGSDLES